MEGFMPDSLIEFLDCEKILIEENNSSEKNIK